MDKQDGHVPGGEQKEVGGLMNLGFFYGHVCGYPGEWEDGGKLGVEKVGCREGVYRESWRLTKKASRRASRKRVTR